MKPLLPIFFWLWPCFVIAQAKEVSSFKKDTAKTVFTKTTTARPEIFTSGFIDIVNNGQINASARFIRLYIGEPGKFAIPVSFYGGVSNNTFQNSTPGTAYSKTNSHLVSQYINPLSGLINISIEGVQFFNKKQKITKPGLLYQVGERVLNGIRAGELTNPLTGKPVNFLNSFATLGLYFQTGAWERNNAKDVGVFWLAMRFHACKSNASQIKEFLPTVETNGFYTGWSAGFGIEINKLVNIKAIYYKYAKAPEIEYGLPIYQFSFNYTMK
ncbi:MAG TPA: hypothetical protein PKA77_13490 [Chitinophagaceae bacterium]|jgi:hypothetical protein|nr:hypothetical protein [Chitinophagaceae bacterium]HMU60016.1 hypothetical protein [Chitinophagaceae bacterium]